MVKHQVAGEVVSLVVVLICDETSKDTVDVGGVGINKDLVGGVVDINKDVVDVRGAVHIWDLNGNREGQRVHCQHIWAIINVCIYIYAPLYLCCRNFRLHSHVNPYNGEDD